MKFVLREGFQLQNGNCAALGITAFADWPGFARVFLLATRPVAFTLSISWRHLSPVESAAVAVEFLFRGLRR